MKKKNNKICCYSGLTEKIESIETKISEIRKSLIDMRDDFAVNDSVPTVVVVEEETDNENEEHGEFCDCVECEPNWPGEQESNTAAYEAVREICLDSLFDVEPKGDA
jgi:hypothetical protein